MRRKDDGVVIPAPAFKSGQSQLGDNRQVGAVKNGPSQMSQNKTPWNLTFDIPQGTRGSSQKQRRPNDQQTCTINQQQQQQ